MTAAPATLQMMSMHGFNTALLPLVECAEGSGASMISGQPDDTMLESWKGYHSKPAFIPGNDGDVEGGQPLHVLHAPLERSPTINDHAGSETVMSINASMDLGSTFPPEGAPPPLPPPKPPSVGPPMSTRTRRILHAITPGAKMQAAREQTLGLAFTDMIRAPRPVNMSRPAPSPPSGPGSVSTTRALQRSHTGNMFDVQSYGPQLLKSPGLVAAHVHEYGRTTLARLGLAKHLQHALATSAAYLGT